MKRNIKIPTVITMFAIGSALPAQASSVNVQSVNPGLNPSYLVTEDALLSSSWAPYRNSWMLGAHYSMVNDPLVELDANRSKRLSTLVDSVNSLNLALAHLAYSQLEWGMGTSLNLVRTSIGPSQFGLGDSRAFVKYRLDPSNSRLAYALMPEIQLPTGSRQLFLSNSSLGGALKFMVEYDFGPVLASANAGFRYSPGATYRDLSMKSGVPLALGVAVPLNRAWSINADFSGEVSVPSNQYVNPSALYVGTRYRMPEGLMFTAAAGVGSLNAVSSADLQVLAGITFIPRIAEAAPRNLKPAARPMAKAQPALPKPSIKSAVNERVSFTPQKLVIRDEVKFDHATARLTPDGANLLLEVSRVLKENRGRYKMIVIEGHTNNVGSFHFNQALSERRADAVKQFLVEQGIDPASLLTVGYGELKQKPLEKTSQGQVLQANRRVELRVIQ